MTASVAPLVDTFSMVVRLPRWQELGFVRAGAVVHVELDDAHERVEHRVRQVLVRRGSRRCRGRRRHGNLSLVVLVQVGQGLALCV